MNQSTVVSNVAAQNQMQSQMQSEHEPQPFRSLLGAAGAAPASKNYREVSEAEFNQIFPPQPTWRARLLRWLSPVTFALIWFVILLTLGFGAAVLWAQAPASPTKPRPIDAPAKVVSASAPASTPSSAPALTPVTPPELYTLRIQNSIQNYLLAQKTADEAKQAAGQIIDKVRLDLKLPIDWGYDPQTNKFGPSATGRPAAAAAAATPPPAPAK